MEVAIYNSFSCRHQKQQQQVYAVSKLLVSKLIISSGMLKNGAVLSH